MTAANAEAAARLIPEDAMSKASKLGFTRAQAAKMIARPTSRAPKGKAAA